MNGKVVDWIIVHDDKWLFTFAYISLSVILSIAISLFWLLAVVITHAILEWIALKANNEKAILYKVFWHLKLDFGLVLFALCLGVYMDVIFGMAGLGAAARTGAQVSSRFIVWQRTIRGILLTLDDVAQVSKALISKKGEVIDTPPDTLPWQNRWGIGDWISTSLFIICLILLILSPLLIDDNVLKIISSEMHPYP